MFNIIWFNIYNFFFILKNIQKREPTGRALVYSKQITCYNGQQIIAATLSIELVLSGEYLKKYITLVNSNI